jgi:hypothetical protein
MGVWPVKSPEQDTRAMPMALFALHFPYKHPMLHKKSWRMAKLLSNDFGGNLARSPATVSLICIPQVP